MPESKKFGVMRNASRIWAIGAVHGDAVRLSALHQKLATKIHFGDRLVYLGDYLGHGAKIRETLDELIRFRRLFLTIPPFMDATDVVYLRGGQEEMWHKLLQLQLSITRIDTLDWMLSRGVEQTLLAYGGDVTQGRAAARDGTMALSQWTRALRVTFNAAPGHSALMSALKRAAYTEDRRLLFVNTGLDATHPLDDQTDSFWWAGRSFASIETPFDGFTRLFRGFDPDHGGFVENDIYTTLDGGCGFGGSLIAACLSPNGDLLERLEV
ncbi:MAG: hypothetical protein ACKVKG_04015 [Alphaproteobacteria bacterium]|jgi:hypothetical protein